MHLILWTMSSLLRLSVSAYDYLKSKTHCPYLGTLVHHTWQFSFHSELPKFTNKPPEVIRVLGTNPRLCCTASGSPRPKVEWLRVQKSSALFPVSQEAGCLVVNTAKKNVEGEYICRATNSLGSAETATTVIVTRSIGIIHQFSFFTILFREHLTSDILKLVFKARYVS